MFIVFTTLPVGAGPTHNGGSPWHLLLPIPSWDLAWVGAPSPKLSSLPADIRLTGRDTRGGQVLLVSSALEATYHPRKTLDELQGSHRPGLR